MKAVRVTVQPEHRSVEVPAGTTALDAVEAAGVAIEAPCGGKGQCGKCRVVLRGEATPPRATERRLLGEAEIAHGLRLACQAHLLGDAEALVPAEARLGRGHIVVSGVEREVPLEPAVRKIYVSVPPPSLEDQRGDMERLLAATGLNGCMPDGIELARALPRMLRGSRFRVTAVAIDGLLAGVERGRVGAHPLGIAVDIGTTTVVGYLMDLQTGQELAVGSRLNPQTRYGADVVSRVEFAGSRPDGLSILNRAILGTLDEIIDETCHAAQARRRSIYEAVVVGNTAMHHLFLRLPPESLAVIPYVPALTSERYLPSQAVRLRIHPHGRVYTLPCIAGFVGADTVGVALASNLLASRGLRVAVDIGTNGEVLVAADGRLLACSTAAGPAFEGARISQGMRGTDGAIDAVSIGEEVRIHVIGDAPPLGICGSGLIDAVAELRRAGIVNEMGRMASADEAPADLPEAVRARLQGSGATARFLLARPDEHPEGRTVALTSRDVRELQLAKGAIFAGISILLGRVGATASEVEELLLAGAFGNYVRQESAVAIGMIPALEMNRIRSIGNAAGSGAKLALLSKAMRAEAREITRKVEYVELSNDSAFYERFTGAMFLGPMGGEAAPAGRPGGGGA